MMTGTREIYLARLAWDTATRDERAADEETRDERTRRAQPQPPEAPVTAIDFSSLVSRSECLSSLIAVLTRDPARRETSPCPHERRRPRSAPSRWTSRGLK